MGIVSALGALVQGEFDLALSDAQSVLEGHTNYDDQIISMFIIGAAQLGNDKLGEGLHYFKTALHKDAARAGGEFVFADYNYRLLLLDSYQVAIVLNARQIVESAGSGAAVEYLRRAIDSLDYLKNDYWSLIHLELGNLYDDMNKPDLAGTHWKAAVDATIISPDFDRERKEKAKTNLLLLQERRDLGSREVTRRVGFAGWYGILGALGVLGILGLAGGGYWVAVGLSFFLIAFVYWKWRSGRH
jgi:hypothetical protein